MTMVTMAHTKDMATIIVLMMSFSFPNAVRKNKNRIVAINLNTALKNLPAISVI
ncbi:MAG: hypothetical protein WC292_08025 [Clostridia bacterium]